MCDTVVVVREGQVLFGKNSDRDPNEAQRLEWHAAATHPEGAEVSCTWLAIPQVRATHAIAISRPYWLWGAEMGANEHGVVIGNEAVFTRARREKAGLVGMDLLRLALERAASADEAVHVITQLLRAHGQGGRCGYDDPSFGYDNSFIVADPHTAIVLETAGREAASERVSGGARAISNGLSIAAFASRHADVIRGAVARAKTRRRRVELLAERATSAQELADVLRDHGEADGDGPSYHAVNGAMGGPCMHAGGVIANGQTVASWVAALSSTSQRHYVTGTAAPCLSAFKPIDLQQPVDLGAPTGIEGDDTWWRFEALHRSIVGDPDARQAYLARRDAWEAATWDGSRAAASAWSDWDTFVAEARRSAVDTRDTRPYAAKRYWRARQRDARAAAPKMPPRQ